MVILKIQQNAYMSNPTSVLTENDLNLKKTICESTHPDFEILYKEELNNNLYRILKELYPKLKS